MAQIYCSNCGQTIDQQANFCSSCGASVQPKPSSAFGATNHDDSSSSKTAAVYLAQQDPQPDKQPVGTARTIERENTSPVAQVLFMLHYLKTTGALLILAAVVAIVDPIMGVVIAAGYLVILALSTHLIWSNYYFSIDETHFKKNYGILHKKSVTIPFEQVQNVNINRSLVDQIFGLAAIDIETAGNSKSESRSIVGGRMSRAEGHLAGIDHRRAVEIHDILLQKVTDQK